jgi:hypothetical protein
LLLKAEKVFDSYAYYTSVMDYAGFHSLHPNMCKVTVAGTGQGA